MASRHDIVTIDFRANAGRANPAIDSLRDSARKSNAEIERMKKELADGKAAGMAEEHLAKLGREIEKEEKKVRAYEAAQKDLVKGVGTLAQAIEAFNNKTLNRMNAAFQKSSYNAAERQISQLKPSSETYKKDVLELRALQQQNLENIAKSKLQTEQLIATISEGGKVSRAELEAEIKGLKELLLLIPETTNEYKTYEKQLKTIQGYVTEINQEQLKQQASILGNKNLGQYNENQLRTAIDAGKELIKTFGTSSKESQELAKNIVDAEKHLEQYGVVAERARQKESAAAEKQLQKEKELSATMTKRLKNLKTLSDDALVETKRYWEGMVAGADKGSAELGKYEKNLKKVINQERQRKAEAYEKVLSDPTKYGFAEVKEAAQGMEKLRDSVREGIPQWQHYNKLVKDGETYLLQLSKAEKVARGETMSLNNALKLAGTAGTSGFRGTAEDLQLAQKAIEQAISTTDKGTAKYERLQQALARIKAEMAGAGISIQKMQQVLANPKGERSVDNLKNAVARARAEMEVTAQRAERLQRLIKAIGKGENKDAHKDLLKNLRQSLKATSAEYDTLAKSTANAEKQQRVLEGQSKNTASAFEKAWSRLKTYVGVYVSAAVAIQKVISTFSKVNELSDKMGEVGKTTGLTNEQLAHLQESLSRISTRTAMNELMSLSAAAGQLGLKTEQDVMAFTRAANMITVALPEMGREGVTELMKIAQATGTVEDLRRQIQAGLIDDNNAVAAALTRVGSTIDALRANSASTAPRITDFVKRVGAVGAQSKISIDQIAALGSTVDALGMRTEMAATALARMIPAIKNNAFAISQAINIAPDEIVRMYEAGDAMQVIVKLLRAMNGKGEEEIEGMLNQRGFGEILKAINQQGARAGQVFAGLAQNVGELERQLDIAHDAFEENIAIQNEYNRMNETTAGKLAKLGNTLTNFFATAGSSKFLGTVYDFLNWFFTNWINNPKFYFFFNTLLGYLAVTKIRLAEIVAKGVVAGVTGIENGFKLMYASLRNAFGAAKDLKTGLDLLDKDEKSMALANAWTAIATALVLAGKALYDWLKEANKVEEISKEAMSRVASEVEAATSKVDDFFKSVGNARVAITDAKDEVQKAEKALEEAKKASDGSRESADKLAKAETDLKVANEKLTIANDAHYASIRKINEQYSPYLGYMLSEISTAAEVANARDLINAKLRETILLKQQESAYGRIEEEFGGERDEKRKNLYSEIDDAISNPEQAAKLRKDINNFVKQWRDIDGDIIRQEGKIHLEFEKLLKQYGLSSTGWSVWSVPSGFEIWNATAMLLEQEKKIADARKLIDDDIKADLKAARTGTENTKGTQKELEEQLEAIEGRWDSIAKQDGSLEDLENKYKNATDKNRKERAAALLQQMDAYETFLNNSKNYFDLTEEDEEKSYKKLITNGDKRMAELRKQREKLVKEAGNAYKPVQTGTNVVTSPTVEPKIWGEKPTAESPYSEWNADDLVARRKSMLTFVRALQDDTDIQTVLKQDEAFQKAYATGLIKNTRDAIDWYNAERMKIQDELHKRYLTDTGDWMGPSKQKGRKKVLKDEWRVYLEELDAYYTERKAKIQEQRNNEEISEAEARSRTVANEAEWRHRRMELQKLYANKSEEVEEREQSIIFKIISERTGETEKMIQTNIRKTVDFMMGIGEKSPEELKEILAKLNLEIEKDFLKQQNVVAKQMNAIADIIAKERPFNGITESLRENLTTMGILTADMTQTREELMAAGEDMAKFNAEQYKQEIARTMFILEQAGKGYSLTWEEMMRNMAENGWQAWADALQANSEMKERLINQVYSVFDKVQEAVRKTAQQLKRQAETMWSNLLLPDGDGSTTIKDALEQAFSDLGIQEGRVSRSNSLIGAGQASERVADKIAIQQMKVQLAMEEAKYDLIRKQGMERIQALQRATEEYERQGNAEKAKQAMLEKEQVERALNLATTKEQTELLKQQEAIIAKTEESQARLYKELQSWSDLISSSFQSVFEASNAGNAEYYNELAKMRLQGGGGGASQYVVIDNAGTKDATAHYEYLTELEYIERKHEIEQQNAVKEAWKKVLDNFSEKMDKTISDQLNAMFQDAATDLNTDAVNANTRALNALTQTLGGQPTGEAGAEGGTGSGNTGGSAGTPAASAAGLPLPVSENGENESFDNYVSYLQQVREETTAIKENIAEIGELVGEKTEGFQSPFQAPEGGVEKMAEQWQAWSEYGQEAIAELNESIAEHPGTVKPFFPMTDEERDKSMEDIQSVWDANTEIGTEAMTTMAENLAEVPGVPVLPGSLPDEQIDTYNEKAAIVYSGLAEQNTNATNTILDNQKKVQQGQISTNEKMSASTNSMFAKMTAAANLYGIAYQAMSNDNLSTAQKFGMIAVQSAGQAAITALTIDMSQSTGSVAAKSPSIFAKLWDELGYWAIPIYAVYTGLVGGLLGLAASKIAKSKSDISSVTGASNSVASGKLTTGMLTYAEGNVNEFTSPGSLTPGKSYNVDAADGRTYRAKYTGKNTRTHITTGPEFHLAGEKGREMIIDAGTTRQITMNEREIYKAIQTISSGGRLRRSSARRGIGAFADGNVDDFADMGFEGDVENISTADMEAMRLSLERNSAIQEALLERLSQPIKATFDVYGKGGLVDSYDTGKKTVIRYGQRY